MSRQRRRGKVIRLVNLLKAIVAFFFSHIGLFALVIAYAMLGSVLFRAVEGPLEKEVRMMVRASRHKSVSKLWSITYEYNTLYEDEWTRRVTYELLDFKRKLLGAIWKGYDARDYEVNVQWTFSGAFLYSLTVITTIGYGNIACRTYFGKAMTIGYAILGIPLMLLFLTNIGDIFGKIFKFLYRRAIELKLEIILWHKRRKAARLRKANTAASGMQPKFPAKLNNSDKECGTDDRLAVGGKPTASNTTARSPLNLGMLPRPGRFLTRTVNIVDSKRNGGVGETKTEVVNVEEMRIEALVQQYQLEEYSMRETTEEKLSRELVPLWLVLLTMFAYLVAGAVLFAVWERWDLLDSFYFCFVSLATIGFGDLFPGASVRDDGEAQEKLVITSLYLLTGMALIAMCFNLAQEEVVSKVFHLAMRLGIVKSESFDAPPSQ